MLELADLLCSSLDFLGKVEIKARIPVIVERIESSAIVDAVLPHAVEFEVIHDGSIDQWALRIGVERDRREKFRREFIE